MQANHDGPAHVRHPARREAMRTLREPCPRRWPSTFAMKSAIAMLLLVMTASCSMLSQRDTQEVGSSASRSPIALPQIPVPGVQLDHSLQRQEVALLSSEYFRRLISGCGMPDAPVDQGEFWSVQLWGGYAGSDYGRFLISKDGRRVTLEPPRYGLKATTRSSLSHHGVQCQ
jgi:hypothetical protein